MEGGINYQPSFRGAMHAEDMLQAATIIDPTPLIIQDGGDAQDNIIVDDSASKTAPPPPPWRHPIKSTKAFFTTLSHHFGWKFLSWLAIDQLFISGGVFALVMALVSINGGSQHMLSY